MQLLDLAPEIFQKITNDLVSSAGVSEAWKLREVSRTFASKIEYDIFMNHCKEGAVRKIIEHDLYRFVSRRLTAPKGVNTACLEKINRMVDFLVTESGITDPKQRDLCLEQLCKGLRNVFPLKTILHELLCPGYSCRVCDAEILQYTLGWVEGDVVEKMLAALAVKSYDAVLKLLPQMVDAVLDGKFFNWNAPRLAAALTSSQFWGKAIEYEASLDTESDDEHMLKARKDLMHVFFSRQCLLDISHSIVRAVARKNAELLATLLELHSRLHDEAPQPFSRSDFDHWFRIAASTSDIEILEILLKFTHEGKVVAHGENLLHIVIYNNEAAVLRVLDHLDVDLNSSDHTRHTNPLLLAV